MLFHVFNTTGLDKVKVLRNQGRQKNKSEAQMRLGKVMQLVRV